MLLLYLRLPVAVQILHGMIEGFWVTQVNYIIGKEYIASFEIIFIYNHEKLFVAGSCPEFFGGEKN